MNCQFCGGKAAFIAIRRDGVETPICRCCEKYTEPAMYHTLRDLKRKPVNKVDGLVFRKVMEEVV